MRYVPGLAAAGLFVLSTIAVANACSVHDRKTADISKPVIATEAPVIMPKPEG